MFKSVENNKREVECAVHIWGRWEGIQRERGELVTAEGAAKQCLQREVSVAAA